MTRLKFSPAAAAAFALLLIQANSGQARADIFGGCGGSNLVRASFYGTSPKTWCSQLNRDKTVQRTGVVVDDDPASIKQIKVVTNGETGTCDLYAITRQGDWHKKFNIGDYESETTPQFRKGVYYGWRLGC